MTGQLDWFKGGIALGLVFLFAVFMVKPIGVSTQFVILDGVIWNAFSDGLIEKNADAKSGYSTTTLAQMPKSSGISVAERPQQGNDGATVCPEARVAEIQRQGRTT